MLRPTRAYSALLAVLLTSSSLVSPAQAQTEAGQVLTAKSAYSTSTDGRLQTGDTVNFGARLITGKTGHISLKLHGGDILEIAPASAVNIEPPNGLAATDGNKIRVVVIRGQANCACAGAILTYPTLAELGQQIDVSGSKTNDVVHETPPTDAQEEPATTTPPFDGPGFSNGNDNNSSASTTETDLLRDADKSRIQEAEVETELATNPPVPDALKRVVARFNQWFEQRFDDSTSQTMAGNLAPQDFGKVVDAFKAIAPSVLLQTNPAGVQHAEMAKLGLNQTFNKELTAQIAKALPAIEPQTIQDTVRGMSHEYTQELTKLTTNELARSAVSDTLTELKSLSIAVVQELKLDNSAILDAKQTGAQINAETRMETASDSRQLFDRTDVRDSAAAINDLKNTQIEIQQNSRQLLGKELLNQRLLLPQAQQR